MILYNKIFVLFVICLSASCASETTEVKQNIDAEILSQEKMKEILVDIHFADAAIAVEKLSKDSLVKILPGIYAKIFEKHEVSFEAYNKSFQYYSRNLELMDEIYENVIEEIENMKIEKKDE